jgi:trehalose 6-phosphate phosphatase
VTAGPPDLYAALRAAAARPCLLVGSDFDGVLAPLVQDPMAARALPGTLDSLAALAALPQTYAAVVSGRDLDTLTTLTSLHDSAVTRIGSHGAQTSGSSDPGVGATERELLAALEADLAEALDAHPGARIETKPASRVLHTRGLDAETAQAAARAALEVAARHTGVTVLEGKSVVELSVVKADKGSALAALAEEARADAVVYFGDDVTDEHVFARLGDADVGVKVGEGETRARWRVEQPDDVVDALAELVRMRSAGSQPDAGSA